MPAPWSVPLKRAFPLQVVRAPAGAFHLAIAPVQGH